MNNKTNLAHVVEDLSNQNDVAPHLRISKSVMDEVAEKVANRYEQGLTTDVEKAYTTPVISMPVEQEQGQSYMTDIAKSYGKVAVYAAVGTAVLNEIAKLF